MIDDVLAFWFGADPEPSPATMKRWFVKDDKFDAEIRDKFGALYDEAVKTGMPAWRGTARGELALLILLDQFSRNMFRNDPRAFAQDDKALAIARDMLASGRADELPPVQRMFVLLPFQHAENVDVQREGVQRYEALATSQGNTGMLASAWDFAKRHAAIIERFGRFPHRNQVLGRESTPEERAFLEQPDSGF